MRSFCKRFTVIIVGYDDVDEGYSALDSLSIHCKPLIHSRLAHITVDSVAHDLPMSITAVMNDSALNGFCFLPALVGMRAEDSGCQTLKERLKAEGAG